MLVVVIGGTQFMGRLLVEALLAGDHEVILLNRGRTVNPFGEHPRLRHVRCDRLEDRDGFREALRRLPRSDAVVDFVGFQQCHVQDAIEALTSPHGESSGEPRFLTGHYIFISSGSVFWAQHVPTTGSPVLEEDGRDFSESELKMHLERCNDTLIGEHQLRYGAQKLACERVLHAAIDASGFPATLLRLPDVFGPFDNLGGFWDLTAAIEAGRPIPARTSPGRARGKQSKRRFSWAFSEDVRDALLACLAKGSSVHGATLHVACEEAVDLFETAELIAQALGLGRGSARFDHLREAAVPSTDFGSLDISRALRLLRPWRPTPLRRAVKRAVDWFVGSKENRDYHRVIHQEIQRFDFDTCGAVRTVDCAVHEVAACWTGSLRQAPPVLSEPLVLNDAMPNFTGHAVLTFMQRLIDQAGDATFSCELVRQGKLLGAERQACTLRHLAGSLLQQSDHKLAYRLESADALAATDLLPELRSPLAGICEDELPPDALGTRAATAPRSLRMGGAGARWSLRRNPVSRGGGFWDCVLLGRRKWRLFPPATPSAILGCEAGVSTPGSAANLHVAADESPADCFAAGPRSDLAVQAHLHAFAPPACWECEQGMGDAVVVPDGWWYQSYDEERVLSISGRYRAARAVNDPCNVGAGVALGSGVGDAQKAGVGVAARAGVCLAASSGSGNAGDAAAGAAIPHSTSPTAASRIASQTGAAGLPEARSVAGAPVVPSAPGPHGVKFVSAPACASAGREAARATVLESAGGHQCAAGTQRAPAATVPAVARASAPATVPASALREARIDPNELFERVD